MDEIFQDVTDAFHWCRSHLPEILGAVDIDNYVVGGDSAGGTLSTMCGHLLEPRPRVVLDLFGVVDNLDPEFMKHDPNSHIQSMPYEKADRDEDELRALLASRDKSKAAVTGAWSWELAMPIEDLKTFWGIKEYDTEEDTLRMDAFIYIAKSGMRLDNLYRREECASDQEFEERLKSWSSLLRLEGQTTYPPTYIIHGIADTAVPVGQSYRFQKKLQEMGVDTGASYAPGAEHSFDSQISVSTQELRESLRQTG
jgi:acetyl esterase/lipase